MSKNPLSLKIAAPYARALFDYAIEQGVLHQTTLDCQNLDTFFKKTPELVEYLSNPVVNKNAKQEIITKTIKSKISKDIFNLLCVLISRDRINLAPAVINSYLELVYATASIKKIEVITAYPFRYAQRYKLVRKLKALTNAREIRLVVTVDPTLIGGFLIKTQSKVIDFTVKTQLQNLAKHLDSVLEI